MSDGWRRWMKGLLPGQAKLLCGPPFLGKGPLFYPSLCLATNRATQTEQIGI